VEVDVPVLTSKGVVGRVVAVAYTRSQVLLAGDPNCRFAAQVAETRAKGIISPNPSSLSRLIVDFTYAPIDSELAAGQSVVTSGDGGVFPKDIPVGRILSVQTNEYGLYLEAQVRLAEDLNRIEEVWLMMP
jgi:rod shape-determining protein MreC